MSKKSPKVKMVTGSVRITSIGLTKKFKTLRTIATIIAVKKESTPTPGRA